MEKPATKKRLGGEGEEDWMQTRHGMHGLEMNRMDMVQVGITRNRNWTCNLHWAGQHMLEAAMVVATVKLRQIMKVMNHKGGGVSVVEDKAILMEENRFWIGDMMKRWQETMLREVI
jgi:hypothetical protein